MQIHQAMVSARPGDAVTNAALDLRSLLREIGPSDIYSRYVHESLHHDVWELKDREWKTSASPESDLLVYHASIGEPDAYSFLLSRPERLVVYYHNISPPERWDEYDPTMAGLLRTGRAEVAGLADRAVMAVAVSEYNAAELRDMGYRDVRIAPLAMDPRRLVDIAPIPEQAARLDSLMGPVVLFVGQVVPHKRVDFLLEMFHVLTTYHCRPATLAVVGHHRLARLSQSLERFRAELNLSQVIMTGAVTDAELAGWYRRADVLVTASEHEGFWAPPLEAMAHGVPVVARSFGAIPETVGDAGLLLDPESGPEVMAEAVARVLEDVSLRETLVKRGYERAASYDADRARAALLSHLMSVLEPA